MKSTNTGIPVLFIYFYVDFVFVMFHVVCACQFTWYVSLSAECKVLVTRERDRTRYFN